MINPGDTVDYVPKQNQGDNIHLRCKVIALGKRLNFFHIDVPGIGNRYVHRKRLLVGQVDAFQETEGT